MITTVTIGGKGPDGSERTSQTVACDQCPNVLDPGEHWADSPWSAAQALSAAERRGWYLTADTHLCPVCWPTTTLRIDLGAA